MKDTKLTDVNEGIQNLAKICSDLKDMEKNFSEVNELKLFFSAQLEKLNGQIESVKEKIEAFNEQYEKEEEIHNDVLNMYYDFLDKYDVITKQMSVSEKFDKYDRKISVLEEKMGSLTRKICEQGCNKKVVETNESRELSQPSEETAVEENYLIDSDEDTMDVDGITFLGQIKEANFVKVNNYKNADDEKWHSTKELFGGETYAFIEEENLGLYKLQYPMQIEFSMKKMNNLKYLNGEVLRYYVNNVKFLSMPKADKEVERVLFSKKSGPKSLFQRVMYIMSEASTILLVDRNWNRTNTKKGNIPQSLIDYVKNFDIKKWRLCYALVKKESGKFHYTTWEVDYENETYLVTVGNSIIIDIIRKENGILPLCFVEVLDNPNDAYYRIVDSVNTDLMKNEC